MTNDKTASRAAVFSSFVIRILSFLSGSWCNSSISPCEGDGPGANPGFLTKKKMRGERSKEIGLSASGFCSWSTPSPGSKISMPVFGCELFVAQSKNDTIHAGGNRKLFTAIHRFWISNFEPVCSVSGSSLEWFCIMPVQFAVRFRC